MFEAIKQRCRRIMYLDPAFIVQDIIQADETLAQDIVDLNRYDQLYDKGIRADGSTITPLYANSTIKYKIRDGQKWDHVTLNDKGGAYESFNIAYSGGAFKITADLDKPGGNLAERYGKTILGLTEENIAIVRGWIKPRILDAVRKKVFE